MNQSLVIRLASVAIAITLAECSPSEFDSSSITDPETVVVDTMAQPKRMQDIELRQTFVAHNGPIRSVALSSNG